MDYRIEIRDRTFNVLDFLESQAFDISWEYQRLGGCGQFAFGLPIRFAEDVNLGGNFNVRIYKRNASTKEYDDLRYQGRIENKGYSVYGKKESIRISGFGYQSELKDIYVDADYSSQEASVIIKSILDNHIVPNTNITYDVGDIEVTSFTFDTLEINGTALSALETIANVVGSREWGIDKDRKFFFKARSESTSRVYPMPGKIIKYSEDDTYDIVNRVIVIGGDVGGTTFTRIVDHAQSQLKWNRRDRTIQNSAIVTNTVADQFAAAMFAEYSDASFKARAEILDDTMIEESTPIGLINVLPALARYGTKKYKMGMYSGKISLQVNRVGYRIDGSGNLITTLEIGKSRPSIAENIGQLQNQIESINAKGV